MTLTVTVNGSPRQLDAGATVGTLVESLSAAPQGRGVAVAIAGEVIPRSAWDQTAIGDGAEVEIVVAVQGG